MVVTFYQNSKDNHEPISTLLKHTNIELFRGSIPLTKSIIKSISFKNRYTYGSLNFEEKDIKNEVLQKIIILFQNTFLTNLKHNEFNILWLKEQSKNAMLLRFIIPRMNLQTNKSLSIYWHQKDRAKKLAFQKYINIHYKLSDPHDEDKYKTLQTRRFKNKITITEEIHNVVEEEIFSGALENRDDIIEFFKISGIDVLDIQKKLLVIKIEDYDKNIVLKGLYYEENFSNRKNEKNSTKQKRISSERARTELKKLIRYQKRIKNNTKKPKTILGTIGIQQDNFNTNTRYCNRSYNRTFYSFKLFNAISNKQRLDSATRDENKKQKWSFHRKQKRYLELRQNESTTTKQNNQNQRFVDDNFRDQAFISFGDAREKVFEAGRKTTTISENNIERAKLNKKRTEKTNIHFKNFRGRFEKILQRFKLTLNENIELLEAQVNLEEYFLKLGFTKIEELSSNRSSLLKSINNQLFLINIIDDTFYYYNFTTKISGTLKEYILSSTNLDLMNLKNVLQNIEYTSTSPLISLNREEQKIQNIYYESENYFDDFEYIKKYKKKMTFPLNDKNGVVGLAFYDGENTTYQKGSKSGVWYDVNNTKSKQMIVCDSFEVLYEEFKKDRQNSFMVVLKPFTNNKLNFIHHNLSNYDGSINIINPKLEKLLNL